jgi:hypothetical protein
LGERRGKWGQSTRNLIRGRTVRHSWRAPSK